jgi:hypothetical protein
MIGVGGLEIVAPAMFDIITGTEATVTLIGGLALLGINVGKSGNPRATTGE